MNKQLLWWLGALVLGLGLGFLDVQWINAVADFVATVYTRLFKFLALPTVALAVTTTLISFGREKGAKKIFGHTLLYTILTTLISGFVALGVYLLITPGNLPAEMLGNAGTAPAESLNFQDYVISIIPDNIVQPFLSGNILAVLLISVTIGLSLAWMKDSEGKQAVIKVIGGLQELFFNMIRGLVQMLPLGIVAFSAQLAVQLSNGGIIIGWFVGEIRTRARACLHHSVCRYTAGFPALPRPEPVESIQGDEPRSGDGIFHKEFYRNPAHYAAGGREPARRESQGCPLFSSHLHHCQHQWLRGVHHCYCTVRDAKRRNDLHAGRIGRLDACCSCFGNGKRRNAHGVLFHRRFVAHQSRRSGGNNGCHSAHIRDA